MSMTVLAIDDSATVRDILRLTLDQAGMETVMAEDGHDGLAALKKMHPDIIITDAHMPNLDGFDFIREVRNRPELDGIPVFMLTTDGPDDVLAKVRASGATGWIEKPFSPPVLIRMLESLVS